MHAEVVAGGGGDGGAKLLPAVGAGAAFPSPQPCCLPARLPAHQPTAHPPPLISEFPDFDLLFHLPCICASRIDVVLR